MGEILTGLTGKAEWTVDENMTAEECKSGTLPVFATPMLVALMECAACDAVKDALQQGSTSVGTEMNVKHIAASAVGACVRAEAKLASADGRKLVFEISAFDGEKLIGNAEHTRFIVDETKFMSKLGK